MQPKKRLKIGEVSKLLNIPAYVLRYWEAEFPELQPDKSRAGQRLYDETEIEFVRKIAYLRYSEKLTISGCKDRLVNGKSTNHVEVCDQQNSENIKSADRQNSEKLIDRIRLIKKGLQDVLEELG